MGDVNLHCSSNNYYYKIFYSTGPLRDSTLMVGFKLCPQILNWGGSGKHTSLLRYSSNDVRKKFYSTGPLEKSLILLHWTFGSEQKSDVSVIKLFCSCSASDFHIPKMIEHILRYFSQVNKNYKRYYQRTI